jgi:hypothetical protein
VSLGYWRNDRAVYRTRLLNGSPGNRTLGSNPSSSAVTVLQRLVSLIVSQGMWVRFPSVTPCAVKSLKSQDWRGLCCPSQHTMHQWRNGKRGGLKTRSLIRVWVRSPSGARYADVGTWFSDGAQTSIVVGSNPTVRTPEKTRVRFPYE